MAAEKTRYIAVISEHTNAAAAYTQADVLADDKAEAIELARDWAKAEMPKHSADKAWLVVKGEEIQPIHTELIDLTGF